MNSMDVPNGSDTVVILTNGNFFSNLALRQVLMGRTTVANFEVWVTTGLRRPNKNRPRELLRLFRLWGLRYTSYKVATYVLPALANRITRRALSVIGTCKELEIPFLVTKNVNDPDLLRRLHESRPAILVSYSCPYRISTPVLAVPTIGSINVHSSLLPRYAGVCTYVHVLANGESETGVTVHEMVERFDAGRILAQGRIPIAPRSSVAGVFTEASYLGGQLLSDVLQMALNAGHLAGTPQDLNGRTYFGEPTKADIARLRSRGHRVIRLRDIPLLLGREPRATAVLG